MRATNYGANVAASLFDVTSSGEPNSSHPASA